MFLTFIQASTHKSKFMQIKNKEVRIYFGKCFLIYPKLITRVKWFIQNKKSGHVAVIKSI